MTGGWTNTGVTTLVIPTGATSGARVVIDGTTGLISVYNSANILVGQWGGTNGCFFEYAGGVGAFVEICGGEVQFGNTGFTPASNPTIIENGISIGGTSVIIDSGNVSGIAANSNLELFGGTGPAGAEIRATQRGVNGDVLQLDTSNNDRQLVHVAKYTGSVADAFGDVVIAHGAAFTPKYGTLTSWDWNSSGQPYQLSWFQDPFGFSPGNMAFFVRNQVGGIPGIGTTVGVHAVLYG